MGAPTDMLVIVATMYNHPKGLLRQEILNIFENELKLPEESYNLGGDLKFGLYGFAKLFNLDHSSEYSENRKKYFNENYGYFSKRPIIWKGKNPLVIEKTHKSLGEDILNYSGYDASEFSPWDGFEVGQYVSTDFFSKIDLPFKKNVSYLVREVLNREIKRDGESNSGKIKQKLKVEAVEFNKKVFEFETFENFWANYPEYHPERIYNFDQRKGFLYPHEAYGISSKNPSFIWMKKDEKYFLDFNYFFDILNSNSYFGNEDWKHSDMKNKSTYSLTDVILTCEAIRRGEWSKLGYNAFFGDNRNFIYKNEKTFRKYEQAVLDTELSVKAMKEGWTNFEFLREHHFDKLVRIPVEYSKIKEGLKEENKRRGIEQRKKTLKIKREKEENPEEEMPF